MNLVPHNGNNEHWLPKSYLRQFTMDNEYVWVLDLLRKPAIWVKTGLNRVCQTKNYHSDKTIDTCLDELTVKPYGTIIKKIVGIDQGARLDEVLSDGEIESLWRFIMVQRLRNPLRSYNGLFAILYDWCFVNPDRKLPETLLTGVWAQIGWAISRARSDFSTYHITERAGAVSAIACIVHSFLMEDDLRSVTPSDFPDLLKPLRMSNLEAGKAFDRMKAPVQLDKLLIDLSKCDPPQSFSKSLVAYTSEDNLYTCDFPFLSKAPDTVKFLMFPMTPHHLLVYDAEIDFGHDADCSEEDQAAYNRSVETIAVKLPYWSFSSRLLSPRPYKQIELFWQDSPSCAEEGQILRYPENPAGVYTIGCKTSTKPIEGKWREGTRPGI